MSDLNEIEARTLTIKRTFDAPRKIVWEAWTQPEHIALWWGPHGMKTHIKKLDFRVGGEWEFMMNMPDGNNFISMGKYSKIELLELIQTSANFIPMTEGVTLVVKFIDVNEQTELIFSVVHPTEEYCKQQEEMGFYNGWGTVFEGLANYIGELRKQ